MRSDLNICGQNWSYCWIIVHYTLYLAIKADVGWSDPFVACKVSNRCSTFNLFSSKAIQVFSCRMLGLFEHPRKKWIDNELFGVILSNPIFVTDGINHRNTLFSSDLFINCRPLEEFTFSLINLDPFSWIVHQMLVMIPPENDGHENRCMWLSPWMAVILLGVAFFLVILSTIFWRMVVGTFSNQQTIKTNMEAKMEVDGRWCSFSCWWFSGCFAVSLLEVILP